MTSTRAPATEALPARLAKYLADTAPARVASGRHSGAEEDELPRELELIELASLLELPLEKPRELIGELIREASLGMIHAQAGAGKTFFALGMTASLTHGVSFLGYSVAEPFAALYADGEMAAYDLRERLRLLSIPLDRKGAPLYVVTPDLSSRGVPKIDSDEGRDALIAQLDERPEIKLVVLDNLACLTRPDGDDTHGARSFSFVQDLMLECRRRGIACWIVHHSGKSGEQRGTSKRNDVLDVVLKLTPVMSAEGRTEVSVTFEKARHMRTESKVDFTAVLEPGMGEGLVWTRAGSQLPVNQRVRLMLLDGMPPREIATELKTAASFVYRIREQLVQSGDLAKPKQKGIPSGDKTRVVPLSPPLSRGTGDRGQIEGTDRGHRGQRHEY
jgi:hypothetical protein